MHKYLKGHGPAGLIRDSVGPSVVCMFHEAGRPTEANGEAMAIGLDVAEHLEQFRVLRLWHWKTAMQFRKYAAQDKAAGWTHHAAERYNLHADFNLKMVQVLNVLFPIGDTAEQDASK